MPISGGSAMEFETKKQRNNYFRSVNTIINDGLATRPKWAKVPITFTEEDFKLKSAIHNDAMVIEINIVEWIIRKVLVDNGSSAAILFLKTFEKMNLSQHMFIRQNTHCKVSEENQSSQLERYRFLYPSEILTMPEQRLSSLMWSTFITRTSRFSAEAS
jgi:hypothetical protein